MLNGNDRTAFIDALGTRSWLAAVEVCSDRGLDLEHVGAVRDAIRNAAVESLHDAERRTAAADEARAAFWTAPAPRRGQFHTADPFCDCSACLRHYEAKAAAAAGGYRID